MKNIASLIVLSLALFLAASSLQAQAINEGFDDITLLAGNGWVIQNMSSPIGATTWFQGTSTTATPSPGPFNAYDGAANAYIAANFNSTGSTGTISNWLILPNRTLRNGDVFTFYTRKPTISGGMTDYPDRLEVRLSTNGASTNVGSTATSVGDFTTLLLSVNPTLTAGGYPYTWTQYTITVSGLPAPTSGRLAFRYFVTSAGSLGSNSDYIGIDRVVYTPYVCPTLTIAPASVPAGAVGAPYSQSLSQTGALGTPSYAVTAGALPSGLTLSTSGTISGTPTNIGTFNFTVTVSDASGCSGSQAYSIDVAPGAASVAITDLSHTYDATPKAATVTTTPAGLAVDVTYDGSPSAPTNAGSYGVVATVNDPNYVPASASETLVIAQRPITITADAHSKLVGDPDPPLTWSLTSGSLVGGDAITGDLSREPGETAGTYAILQNTITAGPNYALTFVGADLTIDLGTSATTLSAAPASASVGTSITLTASVAAMPPSTATPTGTVTFTEGATPLCAAVPLDGSGEATCAITAALPEGTHTVVATYSGDGAVAGSAGSTDFVVTGTEPTITVSPTMNATYGEPASFTITATGTPTPALAISGDALPAGLTFSDNGDGTATISGTPTAIGTATITVEATNAAGTASDSGTVVVAQRPITVTADAQSKLVGAPDPTLTWSITSGSLVGSDTITGELSREPGETAGTYAILQNTLDAGPNYALTFVGADLTIGIAASTTIVTATPSTASAGTTIELSATVTADAPATTTPTGTVTFTEGATVLCAATLDAAGVATCNFTATLPAGDHLITATYEGDDATASSSGTTTLTVTGSEPTIVAPETIDFTAGVAQTFTITASGTPTPVLSTVGTLPPGVTFIDNGDGTAILTGTIPTTGSWSITVLAENAAGTASADIVIVAAAAGLANVPTLDAKALLMLALALAAIATFIVGRINS